MSKHVQHPWRWLAIFTAAWSAFLAWGPITIVVSHQVYTILTMGQG